MRSESSNRTRNRYPEKQVEEFVRGNSRWLYNWFRLRLSIAAEIEDLVQDTFLIFFRNRGNIRKASKETAYLYGIARKVLMAHVRNLSKLKKVTADITAVPAPGAESRSGRLDQLRKAVSALPGELQVVVQTYYSGKLTYEKTADMLGLSRATVQSRLRKALGLLRAGLTQV